MTEFRRVLFRSTAPRPRNRGRRHDHYDLTPFGFLTFKPPTQKAVEVLFAMDTAVFGDSWLNYSLSGFYVRLGLAGTVSMLFCAFLAWEMGKLAADHAKGISGIAWALCATQAVASSCLGSTSHCRPLPSRSR